LQDSEFKSWLGAYHSCGVAGKISDSYLSKISDPLTQRERNLAVKINANHGAQQ